ncbi:MAG: hypothetical protein IT229_02585 [Flavobacteriales bacterium]|nr:hypothetical protein [Flavobacteriales bacterium]
MNQGPLDRSRFEAIESYVLGSMGPDERARFEEELTVDASLRAEVDLQRENIRAVELGGLTRMLKTISEEQGTGEEGWRANAWKQRMKYAAVIALVLSVSLWLLRPPANERLFAQHFVADPGLPVAMSATDDHTFQDAMVAFKLGDHAEARSKWLPLLQADPNNDTLRYYIANASLALHEPAPAIPFLESLARDPSSAFMKKAQWYLFLAYVDAGDVAKARAVPLDDDATYGERVRAIKGQLD